MKIKILILYLLLSFQMVNAQEVITNLISENGDKSSFPSDFVEFNQKLYFEATSETTGREIWVVDGKENKPYMLKDINPGNKSGIHYSFSESSVIIDKTLYFIANDGTSNGEIWKTDGTTEGTEKVTNFLNSNISKLTLVGENFYFFVKNSYHTLQFWISDGSEEGTRLIKNDFSSWSTPTFQGKCNNTFIFTIQSSGGSKVWRSDGTVEGTYPLTEEIDGNGAGEGTIPLTQYIEFNNELYFISRYYLHKTDGTLANTQIVTSFHSASTRLIDYADVIEANGKLYFSFFEVDYNRLFIWETDGTENGSNKIYDESGNSYYTTSNLIKHDNSLIFCGKNESGRTSLINLNLKDYSITYIKELQNSMKPPMFFTAFYDLCFLKEINNDIIFCSSPIGNYKRKGWISKLTEETTLNIEALNGVSNIFNFEEAIYFSKRNENDGTELWKSDIDYENFNIVENINKSKSGVENTSLITLDSKLIFAASDGSFGKEIWSYDGSSNFIKEIRGGHLGSFPYIFRNHNNEVYFPAYDSIYGYELWKTNGESSGTKIVHDINEGAISSYPKHFTLYKGQLFFIARKGRHHYLCKLNGTNLEFVKDLGENEFGYPNEVKEMISSGRYIYFVNSDDNLWISDGTESGTYRLKGCVTCSNITDVDGKLFFTEQIPHSNEVELWKTDGSEINTTFVKNIGLSYPSEPNNYIGFNGSLLFTATTNEAGKELWKSDGTKEGTFQVTDINLGKQNSFMNANFCILDNTLFFTALSDENGCELWKTDGTEMGTQIVKDINPGIQGAFPSLLTVIAGKVYFQAYNIEYGSELWKSDGTEEGTLLVADVLPGNLSSSPTNIISINDDIFFIAETVDKGRQIWKMTNKANSIPEPFNETEFEVYPNPCVDYINFSNDTRLENISIYNASGKLIRNEKLTNNRVDISQLPSGIYIMKINTIGKTIKKRIIKI